MASTEIAQGPRDTILYTYLDDSIVVERASDTVEAPSHQTIATVASATQTQGYEAATPFAGNREDYFTGSFDGQVLTKPTTTETDTISHQRNGILKYEVESGDTLSGIAAKFNLRLNTIMWANGLHWKSVVQSGDIMRILPVDGVAHRMSDDDTLDEIVDTYNAKKDLVVIYNDIENDILPDEGKLLVIPNGKDPNPVKPPEPEPVATVASSSTSSSSSSYSTPTIQYGGGSHRFPYGYCTYWAALKRGGVPWGGDAKAWAYNAAAYGYSVGGTPAAGAVYVEPYLSGWGHVSYVESVNSDGSFTVSEMNYNGWGNVNYRTTSTCSGCSFIY
ncbi:CHAP domain-containing protein [Patescibacteria group bacterium]